jgi:hypothetical protein
MGRKNESIETDGWICYVVVGSFIGMSGAAGQDHGRPESDEDDVRLWTASSPSVCLSPCRDYGRREAHQPSYYGEVSSK